MAPGNAATLAELTDPARRPAELQEPIAEECQNYWPQLPLELEKKMLLANLRSAPKGSAAGLLGSKNEHFQVLLDNEYDSDMFHDAAEHLARADVPTSVQDALALARLTALLKPNSKVRGIATGDTFRRLVARTLAQQ